MTGRSASIGATFWTARVITAHVPAVRAASRESAWVVTIWQLPSCRRLSNVQYDHVARFDRIMVVTTGGRNHQISRWPWPSALFRTKVLACDGPRCRGRDTSIVAAFRLCDPSELPDTMVMTAVTLGELSCGANATDDPAKRAGRVAVLQHAEATFDPLPYDQGAARLYGQMCAAVRAAGRQPAGGPRT
jgi:hypothetical protein